jgi:hypothetical protein
MAVVWAYAGSTSISATVDTVVGHDYQLIVTDANSQHIDDFSGNGSPMVRTVTPLAGLVAGNVFGGDVRDITDSTFLSAENFVYATPSAGSGGHAGTWSYDGSRSISFTATLTVGVQYRLYLDYFSGGVFFEDAGTPFTATGVEQLLEMVATRTLDAVFEASLWLNQDEFTSQASQLFTSGTPVGVTSYATTADLFRILKIKTPTPDQTLAAQGDLDTATIEINAEIDHSPAGPALTTQGLELCKGVCIDRAADLWRHRESAPGILGVVDEAVPSSFGRYSWERYAQRLSPLKEQWGIA